MPADWDLWFTEVESAVARGDEVALIDAVEDWDADLVSASPGAVAARALDRAVADTERELEARSPAITAEALDQVYSRAAEVVGYAYANEGDYDNARRSMYVALGAAAGAMSFGSVGLAGSSVVVRPRAKRSVFGRATLTADRYAERLLEVLVSGTYPDTGVGLSVTPKLLAVDAGLDLLYRKAGGAGRRRSTPAEYDVAAATLQSLLPEMRRHLETVTVDLGGATDPVKLATVLLDLATRSPEAGARLDAVLQGLPAPDLAQSGLHAAVVTGAGAALVDAGPGLTSEQLDRVFAQVRDLADGLTAQMSHSLERRLVTDRANRFEYEAAMAATTGPAPTTSALHDEVRNGFEIQLDRLCDQLTSPASEFGVGSPEMAALATELQGLAGVNRTAAAMMAASVEAQIETAKLAEIRLSKIPQNRRNATARVDATLDLGRAQYQVAAMLRQMSNELLPNLSTDTRKTLETIAQTRMSVARDTYARVQRFEAAKYKPDVVENFPGHIGVNACATQLDQMQRDIRTI